MFDPACSEQCVSIGHEDLGHLRHEYGADGGVAAARARGQTVFAETCPQYLFLSLVDYERPDFEGARYVMSPPLREAADQEALWRGLASGQLQVVGARLTVYSSGPANDAAQTVSS